MGDGKTEGCGDAADEGAGGAVDWLVWASDNIPKKSNVAKGVFFITSRLT